MIDPQLYQQPYAWLEKRGFLAYGLLPLAAMMAGLTGLRKFFLKKWWSRQPLIAPPIVIIGNIRAGGVGKTPLLIHLVQTLQAQGYCVGVVSRGYGGSRNGLVTTSGLVSASGDAQGLGDAQGFGDEPALIARLTTAPVVVHADRRQAVRILLAHQPVDLILSDDGLQHYRLPRDYEVLVMDARGIGNGFLLPAGPLREGVGRLRTVNHIVLNQAETLILPQALQQLMSDIPITRMQIVPTGLFRVMDDQPVPAALWQQPLHAVCGIGHPPRFFASLQQLKLNFTSQIFADHHQFVPSDLLADRPVVMTEKDAVKIRGFATHDHWYLRITVQLDQPQLVTDLVALCQRNRTSANGYKHQVE